MRASRTLVAAGAAVAVLAIALLIGVQLRDRSTTAASPSASPTPSASAATVVVPSGSGADPTAAAGAGIYNDDFGFIVTDASPGLNIRKESSSVTPWIGSFQQQGFAVSPDGTQIAFWRPASPDQPSEIRIVGAANPQSLSASSGLSVGERGGTIIWARDSSAVAYTVITTGQLTGTGASATKSAIRTFNVRQSSKGPGQVILEWNEAGRIIQPIAWDSVAKVLAAGVTGDGGFMTTYVTARTDGPTDQKQFNVSGRVTMGSVKASTDANFVLGVDIDAGFSFWPLADYSAKVTPAETKYGLTGALWRPGTHQIGFIGPSNQFWLCNVDRNTPLGCGATAFSGVPAGASVRTFRADGGAVLLAVSAGGGRQTTYTLVKFVNDLLAAKATGGERVTFPDVGGVVASVRLR